MTTETNERRIIYRAVIDSAGVFHSEGTQLPEQKARQLNNAIWDALQPTIALLMPTNYSHSLEIFVGGNAAPQRTIYHARVEGNRVYLQREPKLCQGEVRALNRAIEKSLAPRNPLSDYSQQQLQITIGERCLRKSAHRSTGPYPLRFIV